MVHLSRPRRRRVQQEAGSETLSSLPGGRILLPAVTAITSPTRFAMRSRQWIGHSYRSQRIRRLLGGSGSLLEPFPWKPKGMPYRTYCRLRENAEKAEISYLHAVWPDRFTSSTERQKES